MRLWDGRSGAPLSIFKGHISKVTGAQALPDGRIMSWSEDRTLRIWDSKSGVSLATYFGHFGHWGGPKVFPNGYILSWPPRTGRRGRKEIPQLCLWDSTSGTRLATLEGHNWLNKIKVKILPNGNFLTCSEEAILLWDGQCGVLLATIAKPSDRIDMGITVLQQENSFPFCGEGKNLQYWAREPGAQLTSLLGYYLPFDCDHNSSDGAILIISRWDDNTLRLWNGQRGELLATLEGPIGKVDCIQLLSDVEILSWSYDEGDVFQLWESKSSTPISQAVSRPELPWKNPLFLHQYTKYETPDLISRKAVGWVFGNTCGIATTAHSGSSVCYEVGSQVKVYALFPEGILIACPDSGHVLCLQLFYGARRITLEEYEHESG